MTPAMVPLRVEARIRGAVALPNGPIALDGLLAWAVAQREGLPPVHFVDELSPVEIPVAREPGGRFHLATWCHYEVERNEHRWLNRRYPMQEAQMFAEPKLKRIRTNAGACKSYRLPLATMHLVGDTMTWWCLGDEAAVRDLLECHVFYIGKRRGTGLGRVMSWHVTPCEPWGDGFPVVRDGKPMRPLPPDWPGLVDPGLGYSTLTYPYWNHAAETLCALPEVPA